LLSADLYFSIRSPFSYIALQQLERLLPGHNPAIAMQLKPLMPIAVRKTEVFHSMDPLVFRYLELDARRTAEMENIDIRVWPVPDPIVQDLDTLAISTEQPYIWRLTRLLQCAIELNKGFEFAVALSRLIWDGKVDNWHTGKYIENVTSSVGLSFHEMETMIENKAEHYDAEFLANHEALAEFGQWIPPTIVFEGEPFCDQDRVTIFLWRARQKYGSKGA
jgi:2-hydroxychromene-2-carboxylate isomerase